MLFKQFSEPQKIQVENLFRTVYGDMDNSKEYKNALDYRVMNDDGGLPSSPFFEIPLTEELRAAKIKNPSLTRKYTISTVTLQTILLINFLNS